MLNSEMCEKDWLFDMIFTFRICQLFFDRVRQLNKKGQNKIVRVTDFKKNVPG